MDIVHGILTFLIIILMNIGIYEIWNISRDKEIKNKIILISIFSSLVISYQEVCYQLN